MDEFSLPLSIYILPQNLGLKSGLHTDGLPLNYTPHSFRSDVFSSPWLFIIFNFVEFRSDLATDMFLQIDHAWCTNLY